MEPHLERRLRETFSHPNLLNYPPSIFSSAERFKNKGFHQNPMESEQSGESQVRKCVTCVVFDRAHTPFFLIMKRQLRWNGWEFVKGGIEAGETEEQAVAREIAEEAGLRHIKILKKLQG